MKPPDFDPSKRYPLLVVIHGGPAWSSQAVMGLDIPYYPNEIWAARGALILEPNYRGSNGYGIAFHRLIVRSFGAAIQDDIESGIDALVAKGWVDKTRVGAMGWSFGGYITAWLATNSDRFAALSAGAAPADWTLFDATTDLQEITRQYLQATPWDDPELYRRSSPIAHAPRRPTPTMIQQGDLDTLVSPAAAYELRQTLADHGVPTRLYLYKGFGHSITRPKGNRAVMEHNLEWFNHYLWGEAAGDVQLGRSGATVPQRPPQAPISAQTWPRATSRGDREREPRCEGAGREVASKLQ